MTEAKIVADSISEAGARITTVQVKLHRFVLAELDTHRAFTRSFSSSRAIPTKKLLEQVRNNPAMPVWWGKNQAGMQANEELVGYDRQIAYNAWMNAAHQAADMAQYMSEHGVHKQIVNRIIEPFMWVEGIITSTEWDNFFTLRCHPDAQPELRVLAERIRDARNESEPNYVRTGQWHLPYITEEDHWALGNYRGHNLHSFEFQLAMISAARCCRVSYLKHDGTAPSIEDDLKLFDKLAGSVPIHASPLEHQAIAFSDVADRSRNFVGWQQFREVWEGSLL